MSVVMDNPATTTRAGEDGVRVSGADSAEGWSHPARCVPPTPSARPGWEKDDGSQGWDLVRAVQAGDKAAFGQLYTRYLRDVQRFVACRSWGHREPAMLEDLVADTFCAALDYITRSDSTTWPAPPPGAGVNSWLVSIARHQVLKHYERAETRRATRVGDYEALEHALTSEGHADLLVDAYGNPEHQVLAAFDRQAAAFALRWALARLVPAERYLIQSHELHGQPYSQISQAMGRTRDSLHEVRDRAYRHLADLLAPRGVSTRPGVPRVAVALELTRTGYSLAQRHRTAPLLAPWTGQRVAWLRSARGMTMAGFAGYLGVPYTTVRGWERGSDRELSTQAQALLDIALARATPAQQAQFHRLAAHPDTAQAQPDPRTRWRITSDQAAPTRRAVAEAREQDAQAARWTAFLARWHQVYGQSRVTARQLRESTQDAAGAARWQDTFPTPTAGTDGPGVDTPSDADAALLAVLEEWITQHGTRPAQLQVRDATGVGPGRAKRLLQFLDQRHDWSARPGGQSVKWLGQRLAEHLDTPHGNLVLRKARDRNNTGWYWVEQVADQATTTAAGQTAARAGGCAA